MLENCYSDNGNKHRSLNPGFYRWPKTPSAFFLVPRCFGISAAVRLTCGTALPSGGAHPRVKDGFPDHPEAVLFSSKKLLQSQMSRFGFPCTHPGSHGGAASSSSACLSWGACCSCIISSGSLLSLVPQPAPFLLHLLPLLLLSLLLSPQLLIPHRLSLGVRAGGSGALQHFLPVAVGRMYFLSQGAFYQECTYHCYTFCFGASH